MKKALERLIEYAVQAAQPERILLFGSFATGKNNIYSDVDLLVVSNRLYKRKELENQIGSFARECALKLDVLIHTPGEIEAAAREPLSFLGSIVNQGRIVYKRML
jgi:uncharacterized protein